MGTWIEVKGKPIFCRICASMEMEKLYDEFYSKGSAKDWVIRCARCPSPTIYTYEYVVNNLKSFTDGEEYLRIRESAEELRAIYQKKLEPEPQKGMVKDLVAVPKNQMRLDKFVKPES